MFRRRSREPEGPVPNRLRGMALPGQLSTKSRPAADRQEADAERSVGGATPAPARPAPTVMQRRSRLLFVGTIVCATAILASVINPGYGDAAALVVLGVAAVVMIVFGIAGMVDIARSLHSNPLVSLLAIVVSGWHLALLLGIGLLLCLAVLWTIGLRP